MACALVPSGGGGAAGGRNTSGRSRRARSISAATAASSCWMVTGSWTPKAAAKPAGEREKKGGGAGGRAGPPLAAQEAGRTRDEGVRVVVCSDRNRARAARGHLDVQPADERPAGTASYSTSLRSLLLLLLLLLLGRCRAASPAPRVNGQLEGLRLGRLVPEGAHVGAALGAPRLFLGGGLGAEEHVKPSLDDLGELHDLCVCVCGAGGGSR